jgi:hypothetical protein
MPVSKLPQTKYLNNVIFVKRIKWVARLAVPRVFALQLLEEFRSLKLSGNAPQEIQRLIRSEEGVMRFAPSVPYDTRTVLEYPEFLSQA